jgi:hypothetical protein
LAYSKCMVISSRNKDLRSERHQMIPEVLIAVVGSIASAAALALIGYLWRRATIKRRFALQNLDRMLEWFRYIDVNLDAPDYN